MRKILKSKIFLLAALLLVLGVSWVIYDSLLGAGVIDSSKGDNSSSSANIESIKKGYLNNCPEATIEELVDSYMGSPPVD